MSVHALEAIERIVAAGEEADETLRAVVSELAGEAGVVWAGVLFLEGEALVLGPEAGVPDPARRRAAPVRFHETTVGELAIDGDADPELLEQVAERLAAHVLLGWDTGGEAWEP